MNRETKYCLRGYEERKRFVSQEKSKDKDETMDVYDDNELKRCWKTTRLQRRNTVSCRAERLKRRILA
jgi:hypothetical protein